MNATVPAQAKTQTNTTSNTPQNTHNVRFRVQFAAVAENISIPDDRFAKLKDVRKYREGKFWKYTTGNTKTLQEAREMQIKDHKPLSFNKEISVNNIEFAYTLAPDKIILNDVSCIIKKNTSVAFCGESGAGKTTMIDIILGLLKLQQGTITCDGVDIQTNMKGWRDNISYIPQTIFLMDDTIRRNIAFGIADKNINDDMIWDALEKAQLYKFVKALPNGLDTVIGERGVRLSGGQRQRLGIARAFYRNTNIIVFDEATSALDYENEKKILDHVNQYASDHTLIIITHRLNTIENCDHIYKIANGGIEQVK